MAWSTPPTFVANTTLTAANLNVLRDDLNAIGAAPITDGRSAATIWSGTVGTGGSVAAEYRQLGNEVRWSVLITLGTGFTIGTGLTVPVTGAVAARMKGEGLVFDTSASAYYPIFLVPNSTTQVLLRTLPTTAGNALANVSSSLPVTFANGDTIFASITYRT